MDPPPDAPPVVDELPPFDEATLAEPPMPPVTGDTDTPPPLPDSTDPVAPPPPPVAGEDGLPPVDLPGADPINLDVADGAIEGGAHVEPPMPPVTGDTDTAPPPAAGEVDLGDGGPPVAPTAPQGDAADQGQSPVPPMGNVADQAQSPVPPMGNAVDEGQSPVPPMGNAVEGQSPVPPMGNAVDEGQSPVPPMGNAVDQGVDLGDDGPPMPPVTGDTTTPPPTGEVVDDVTLPANPDATGAEWSMPVAPGDERSSAAAVVGVFLDEMGLTDEHRTHMIDLVAQAATDGTITIDELYAAYEQVGFETVSVDPTADALTAVVDRGAAQPTIALVGVDGNAPEFFRVHQVGDAIHLESLADRQVRVVETHTVVENWRASGGRVLLPPAPLVAPAEALPEVDLSAFATEPEDGSDGNARRNALIAGAVLLPLAGGGAYLASRKLR